MSTQQGMNSNTGLAVRNLHVAFCRHPLLRGIDLDVAPGETLVLFGPSGSGKTVLLRAIAGLEPAARGEVFIDGRNVSQLGPEKRGIGMAFQNFALYPHMPARANIASPLEAQRLTKAEADRRIDAVATLLKITHVLGHAPRELSNGQKQRTALARALVGEPRVLLLDDPLRQRRREAALRDAAGAAAAAAPRRGGDDLCQPGLSRGDGAGRPRGHPAGRRDRAGRTVRGGVRRAGDPGRGAAVRRPADQPAALPPGAARRPDRAPGRRHGAGDLGRVCRPVDVGWARLPAGHPPGGDRRPVRPPSRRRAGRAGRRDPAARAHGAAAAHRLRRRDRRQRDRRRAGRRRAGRAGRRPACVVLFDEQSGLRIDHASVPVEVAA